MDSVFLVFIFSGAGIILFLALKAVQNRFGILILFPQVRNKIEARLKRKSEELQENVDSVSKKDPRMLIPTVLALFKKISVRCKSVLERRAGRILRLIRGERAIEPRNSQSDFLHDISRFRDRFRDR